MDIITEFVGNYPVGVCFSLFALYLILIARKRVNNITKRWVP